MPSNITFKGPGAAVRVSSVGLSYSDQAPFKGGDFKRASTGIKINRLQQQHSFPGQMTMSLDMLSTPAPEDDEEDATTVPSRSGFTGSSPLRSSGGAPPPAQHAWQASSEPDFWTSSGAHQTAAAAEPAVEAQVPAPPPEPEVVPWAVKRTTITSSPAKHSVQIRIPNDRTATGDAASDENAFGGRRGADSGVPRSKLAMAEVRQRRLQEKQKKLAEEDLQSKLRELDAGIRNRRTAAAAAAAAAGEGATGSNTPKRQTKAKSPARSKRRAQPKSSPSRVSAHQAAVAKRLSQPSAASANAAEPSTSLEQGRTTTKASAPSHTAVSTADRDKPSTVDWDSLLVESDVGILNAVASKNKSNSKNHKKSGSKKPLSSQPRHQRTAKLRGSKPGSSRRHSIESAASVAGKKRIDMASTRPEGAVGQLRSTWQQLQHEPGGKRNSAAGTSSAGSLSSRLGKPSRIPMSNKATASASRAAGPARSSLSSSAAQKQKRRKGGLAASPAKTNGSKNSLDSLLTDETSGSHTSSPLNVRPDQLRGTVPSPLSLSRPERTDDNESMLQEMNALLADLMQQEDHRARAETKMLELRETAAQERADAERKWISAHGESSGGGEQEAQEDYIDMKLAAELAEIRKITAHQEVERARHVRSLQQWEERISSLCDETEAFRRGVSDTPADGSTIRELMLSMGQLEDDRRKPSMESLRKRAENGGQQEPREQDLLHSLVQQQEATVGDIEIAHTGLDSPPGPENAASPADLAAVQDEGADEGSASDHGSHNSGEETDGANSNARQDDGGGEDDVEALAAFLGIDPAKEPNLMWIARQCLDAQLPAAWSEYFEEGSGNAYYFNELTEITTWEHPLDAHFKAMVQEERLAHAARKVLSSANYSTATGAAGDSADDSQQRDEVVAQSEPKKGDASRDENENDDGDDTDRPPAIGLSDLNLKPAPRMVQSTDGKPLDLSDLIASASTTPAKESPDRSRHRTMLSPKSLAAQMISLSSDSDSDIDRDPDDNVDVSAVGKLIPTNAGTHAVSSPAYSDQSSLDVEALEKSLLEHHRSTSPSPHQEQSVEQQQILAINDEILSDISAHSEESEDEGSVHPRSPHEPEPVRTPKLDDDLDTSLSQTELDVIVQQLHHIEDEEEDAMCEQDRDMKAMAALKRIAEQGEATAHSASPISSPGPSYVEPVLSPSRVGGSMNTEMSQSGLVALRELIKEALGCEDLRTVQTIMQQVMTRGQQLQEEEQESLQPDIDKLVAAAHRMERTAGKDADSDDGDYDDDFEDEDEDGDDSEDQAEDDAHKAGADGSASVVQRSPTVTPTIDPVQTSRCVGCHSSDLRQQFRAESTSCCSCAIICRLNVVAAVRLHSPTKKELLAGIGEADNAFAYVTAIQNVRILHQSTGMVSWPIAARHF